MALFVDPPRWPAHGRLWSHLVSDRSVEELHAFARALGLPARAFEGDHYDVPEERYPDVVAAGARAVSGGELIRRLRASGLRRPKRRGERVVASRALPTGVREDVLVSSLAPAYPVAGVRALVTSGAQVLAVAAGDGWALPRVVGGAWATARQVGYVRWVPVRPAGTTVEVVVRAEAPLPGGASAASGEAGVAVPVPWERVDHPAHAPLVGWLLGPR